MYRVLVISRMKVENDFLQFNWKITIEKVQTTVFLNTQSVYLCRPLEFELIHVFICVPI